MVLATETLIKSLEIKRQKSVEQELGFKFMRIDRDEEEFDIFKAINKIFRRIKKSPNKLTKAILRKKFQ